MNRINQIIQRLKQREVNRPLAAYRLVQIAILISLFWKWRFFLEANSIYANIPVEDSFFPDWLRSVATIRYAFWGSALVICIGLVTSISTLRKTCSWFAIGGITIMCIHQGSYNDMTFVTIWWCCLWSVWLAHRLDTLHQEFLIRRAAFLSRLIISLILLGGAAGKWTPEYWSGDVLFDIYFVDRDFWLFNYLRDNYEPEDLKLIAKWYSRQVIVVETIGGIGLWVLPARWAALSGVMILSGVVILSNKYLLSVIGCLIGLACVGFFVPRRPRDAATFSELTSKTPEAV
ncbi:hypothetical protein N9A80_01295 [Rhodopirellula sp.]|nr:hypothetical protein [Rhodopirellula sp.]MDA7904958.1 hypothetical protein [Rhodopirellula sp.]MDB4423214.1 hypothetical protein [Rhodopirellula sp.]MDB4557734.1 hypothetical protein [bacterium]